ncbi:bacteriocin biosynthesis cyclodehydratase domain-containing protein [Amycolatopsis marina]|uniref:Bacteriocin biosynthesis cyclodehydratase domain-containing protein n=1 Tax=Amycolatopsis marina TaxID=490629 RepID=A0A1I1CFP9_9PSEU|nr:bacteriocin biosynthesis cyclodehydratase domain-containing protein [Amycolatopsis marina]
MLERAADEIQIGLDPRHAVVAQGLPPNLIDLLRGLDGSRSTRTLLDAAGAVHGERLREILTGLTECGLVEEAYPAARHRKAAAEPELWSLRAGLSRFDAAVRREQCCVLVHGGGRLAVAVSVLLATAGIGRIDVRAAGTVGNDELGSGYLDTDIGRPRRRSILEAVLRANPDTRAGRSVDRRSPDLVLLTDAIVPAPEVVRGLLADGLPHLPVQVRDGIGIVGPLVWPGRSSCLRCADLHRTDRDSCWPRIASQLAGQSRRADLGAVQATASLAATQALRVLCHNEGMPPVWNSTLEVDSYEATVYHRPWLPHPDCGCGAPAPGAPRPRSAMASPG